METSKPLNVEAYVRTLKILHIALLTMMVLFGAVSCFIVFTHQMPVTLTDVSILNMAVPAIAIAAIAASMLVFKKKLDGAREATSLDEKLSLYRSAFILKLALLEGPALLAKILFMLSASIPLIVTAGVLIAWFATQHPTRDKMISDLGVDDMAVMEWERGNER